MIKTQFKKNLIIFAATFLILTLAGIVAYKIMNSRTFQFYGGIVNCSRSLNRESYIFS